MLQEGGFPSELTVAETARMWAGCTSGARPVGEALEISRLDGGALKPELSSFRLDELMRQLQREFEPSAQEKGLKLVFMPTSLTLRSDRRLLRRLLQNLISNAIKYTPNGKVLIGCRRRGNQVAVEVIDTGLGIPQSKQKTVFREFQRLDQGAKVARGLGLGLSIVQRIARALDHGLTLDWRRARLALLGAGAARRAAARRWRPAPLRAMPRPGSSPGCGCSSSTTSPPFSTA